MRFLEQDREICERFMPGLLLALRRSTLLELEKRNNPGLQLFRDANGPAMLIPESCGGLGVTPVEAIRVQRAIGSVSPSLAVASAMHHFTVATVVEMSRVGNGLESLLLEGVAQDRLLLASGFAEGQPGRGILKPMMKARPVDGGVLVSGCKKPCSLSASMDLLTASVWIQNDVGDEGQFAVVLIPASAPGLERREFWGSWILAGAESEALILNEVEVPEALIFRMGQSRELDAAQVNGFLWFELLITASYLGVASALVERVLLSQRGSPAERMALGIELEGAMSALEGVARLMMIKHCDSDELARMLFVRYLVQGAIERASQQAAEILGGMAFVSSSEVSYLLAAARALAFHPPSKTSVAQELAGCLVGETTLKTQ